MIYRLEERTNGYLRKEYGLHTHSLRHGVDICFADKYEDKVYLGIAKATEYEYVRGMRPVNITVMSRLAYDRIEVISRTDGKLFSGKTRADELFFLSSLEFRDDRVKAFLAGESVYKLEDDGIIVGETFLTPEEFAYEIMLVNDFEDKIAKPYTRDDGHPVIKRLMTITPKECSIIDVDGVIELS